jgi:hypothetical protein
VFLHFAFAILSTQKNETRRKKLKITKDLSTPQINRGELRKRASFAQAFTFCCSASNILYVGNPTVFQTRLHRYFSYQGTISYGNASMMLLLGGENHSRTTDISQVPYNISQAIKMVAVLPLRLTSQEPTIFIFNDNTLYLREWLNCRLRRI